MAATIHFSFLGSWSDSFHQAWNAVASLVDLLYVIVVVRIPTERFPRGRRSKAWWIAGGIIPGGWGFGLFVPIGVLVAWPLLIHRYRRGNVAAGPGRKEEAEDKPYSFYPRGIQGP